MGGGGKCSLVAFGTRGYNPGMRWSGRRKTVYAENRSMTRSSIVTGILTVLAFSTATMAGDGIKGTVKFKEGDKVYKFRDGSSKLVSHPFCAAKWKGKAFRKQSVVHNENGTLRYIFVHIKSGLPDKKWDVPNEPVVLAQVNCRYEPHVFGVMAGQTIEIRNSDGTAHNIHAVPKANTGFNKSQPHANMKMNRSFKNPEMEIKVKCDVHPWMQCWIHVLKHPFHDTTGKDGSFEIKTDGLPDGGYELEALSEYFKPQTAKIKIEGGKVISGEITFTFGRGDKKS